MIICFSGNGNTRFVAERLGCLLGDSVIGLRSPLIDESSPSLDDDRTGRVIWAFPVYGWGIPAKIRDFISKVMIADTTATHYMVATCGDDIGETARQWRQLTERRGFKAAGAWSVTMPNTYVSLPGFDVDDDAAVCRKLSAAPQRVKEIADGIKSGFTGESVIKGSMPEIKSSVLRPLFEKLLMSPKLFRSTTYCVGCGICARSCPMGNISVGEDSRPHWSDNCAMCLACYHSCPHHAVAYSVMTNKKGQYSLRAALYKCQNDD